METVTNDITEIEKELSVQLTADELVPHFERAYQRIQPKMEIKGFRKGKVPVEVIKKMYGEQIEFDSLDVIATDVYREVAKEKNIQPVGEPRLVDMDYKRGESFSFKIQYEILPQFTVSNYKGIQLEKLIHSVTEQEVSDEILRIRRANATLVEAQSADDDEHIVTADVQELDDTGFPMIGKKNENQRFYLGEETLIEEVKTKLRQASIGSPLRIKYESQHGDHTHKTHIEVTPKKIEKIQLPELDDAFVAKVTKNKVATVAAFRENLLKDLEAYWNDRSERKAMDMLAAEIVRRHDFPVPDSFVRGIIDRQLEDMKNRLPEKQFPPDFDETKYREDLRPSAIFQARWYLIRERIIEQEGLKIEDADLERIAEERSKQTGIEQEKLIQFFKSSEETQRQILSEKLITFLKLNAKITEKVTEEFF
jgi:trigger factor